MKTALVLIALIVLAFLVMDFNGRVAELKRLEDREVLVSEQMQVRKDTIVDLNRKLEEAKSPAAAVHYALSNHMIMPEDHPVVVLEGEEFKPEPVVVAMQPAIEESNFDSWLSLFFESSTP